jgi:hypothetical protein
MRFSTTTRTSSVRFQPLRNYTDGLICHWLGVADAVSHGELFHLDMGLLKAANSTALAWTDVEKAPYSSDYVPVMALAQNHIFFLDVPGVPAGSAAIYVIHCKTRLRPVTTPLILSVHTSDNYFQPGAQAFPASNGAIPATHGRTASFFQDAGVCRHPCCIHYIHLIVTYYLRLRYKKHLHSSRMMALRLTC